MQDPRATLVGGAEDEGKTDDEIAHEHEAEEHERAAFTEAWKAMYLSKGIDPDTYRVDWDAVFEGERGE